MGTQHCRHFTFSAHPTLSFLLIEMTSPKLLQSQKGKMYFCNFRYFDDNVFIERYARVYQVWYSIMFVQFFNAFRDGRSPGSRTPWISICPARCAAGYQEEVRLVDAREEDEEDRVQDEREKRGLSRSCTEIVEISVKLRWTLVETSKTLQRFCFEVVRLRQIGQHVLRIVREMGFEICWTQSTYRARQVQLKFRIQSQMMVEIGVHTAENDPSRASWKNCRR